MVPKKIISFNFHTSAVLYSHPTDNNNSVLTNLKNQTNNNNPFTGQEITHNLPLIPYSINDSSTNKIEEDLNTFMTNLGNSNYGKAFPWLVDKNVNLVDKKIFFLFFDAIKLTARFLETRYAIDQKNISNVKMTELIKPFEDGIEKMSVSELYLYLDNLYKQDEDVLKYFYEPIKDIVSIPENLSNLKPFGIAGDISVNELAVKLKNLN